jgi:uroporphyrinogen decarboxylase
MRISDTVRSTLDSLGIANVPMTLFAKGANQSLSLLSQAGYDVIGLDWTIEPFAARRIVGDNITLQGNMDPSILRCSPDAIRTEVERLFNGSGGFGKGSRHIANLGHGITPEVDPENMRVFLESVHKSSAS